MNISRKTEHDYQMKEKLNSNKLIAISGVKSSGKDTTSKMFQYCLSVPRVFRQYWLYKLINKIVPKKYKLIAFADPLKKMLSILLNIPINKFNDRAFKELYYVNIPTLNQTFSKDKLSDSKFNKLVKELNLNLVDSNLSIRQLMQYFGTSVMRTYFGENVWINSTLKHSTNKTIITDLRFINEYNAIKEHHGISIYINRPGYYFGEHASEREMELLLDSQAYDYVIDNSGSFKDLFNQIKNIANDISGNCN